jgi:hypothetical protein
MCNPFMSAAHKAMPANRVEELECGVYTKAYQIAAALKQLCGTITKILSYGKFMKRIFATAVLLSSFAMAAPAVASGYGPAPFYRPSAGAPSSQQGPSAQTIAAEQAARGVDSEAYGSSCESQTQSGKR